MSDHPQNSPAGDNSAKRLSEISHLFLSSVRDRQTGGAPRPLRKPPGTPRPDLTVDLTPEEFAHVSGETDASHAPAVSDEPRLAPVTAILGTHLNGRLFDRVKEYAAHLCTSQVARVGLIEVDAAEFRVMLFERSISGAAEGVIDVPPIEGFDPRRMAEALEELNWDVDRWLLLAPALRDQEARALLAQVDHWVLLSTCDHDGVVAGYRTLKGVAELSRPRVSLALLDAHDEAEAAKVARKLASVSQQFLHFPVEIEPAVHRGPSVSEYLVLCCRASREDAPVHGSQWQVVSKFLNRIKPAQPPALAAEKLDGSMDRSAAPGAPQPSPSNQPNHSNPPEQPWRQPIGKQFLADVVLNERLSSIATTSASLHTPVDSFEIRRDAVPATGSSFEMRVEPVAPSAATSAASDDVIDLPQGASSPAAIVGAMLRRGASELVDCPIKPPMCPDATIAVSRDRRLVLLAVASEGLGDLRAIGRAYQWLMENRGLVAMAIPQFSIDARQVPRLQLLVDQADASAEILQPMLESGNVTVHASRPLRWAGRVGLLLDAA